MGTAERRQREAGERRRAILAAAQKVFWELGYARATMPQIAAEAELAPGTLYLYFPGKDALYVELLVKGYAVLLEALQSAVRRGEGKPREVASALIDAFFAFAREHPEYFNILFFVIQRENSVSWEAGLAEDQLRRIKAGEAACKRVVVDMLERAGFSDADHRAVSADAVWSMLAGVVFYFRLRDSFNSVSQQAKALLLSAVFGEWV